MTSMGMTSGIQQWDLSFAGPYSGPYISPTSNRALIFGLNDRSMVEIDLMDASETGVSLPEITPPVALGIDNKGGWLIFSIPSGNLYKVEGGARISLIAKFPELRNHLVSLAPDPTSPRLLFISQTEGLAYVIDGESGATLAIVPTYSQVDDVLFSQDGTRVLLASLEAQTVHIYSWPAFQKLKSVPLLPHQLAN